MTLQECFYSMFIGKRVKLFKDPMFANLRHKVILDGTTFVTEATIHEIDLCNYYPYNDVNAKSYMSVTFMDDNGELYFGDVYENTDIQFV